MQRNEWKRCLVASFWVTSTKFGLSVNASIEAWPPQYASYFPTVFQVAYFEPPDSAALEKIVATTKDEKEIGSRLLQEFWLAGSPAPAVDGLRRAIVGSRNLIATFIDTGILSQNPKIQSSAGKAVWKLPRLVKFKKEGVLDCHPSTPCSLDYVWRMDEGRMWYWTLIGSGPNVWKFVSETYHRPVN